MAAQAKASEEISFRAPGSYFLRLRPASPDVSFVRVWLGDPSTRPLFVPMFSPIGLRVTTSRPDTALFFDADEVTLARRRRWRLSDLLVTTGRWNLVSAVKIDLKEIGLDNSGIAISSLYSRTEKLGRRTAHLLDKLSEWGIGISTRALQDTLLYEHVGHESAQPERSPHSESPSACIVIHLHYSELWRDFEKRLRRLSLPFKLFVTQNSHDAALVERVKRHFPDASIIVYPNRGRDVGPFIQLWRDGHLRNFELVCKLHGKRTSTKKPNNQFGQIWRRAMLNALIGSDAIVTGIIKEFSKRPKVGMVGPSLFRLPNSALSVQAWGGNKPNVLELARAIGIPEADYRLDFFAGTMFWMRTELLDLLKPLDLSQSDFPDECGQQDGTLHHALERLFGALPQASENKMAISQTEWRYEKPL